VLGNDGRKMSKSLRNYPNVNEVFDTHGSDAMRWFLMASPILRGGNLVVTEQGIREGVRQALLPLWNSYYFFALYANAENHTAARSLTSAHVLDRYILAKTRTAVEQMAAELDRYDIAAACQGLRDYLELLTNWYIRRSRSRFWEGDQAALDTLWTVLETVTRAAAPLLPMTAETIWRGLTGGVSVHLEDWPSVADWPSDPALAETMDLTRAVCSAALSLRKARQLRVRLPLASLTVAHPAAPALTEFADLIKDEVNVKDLVLSAEPASLGAVQLTVNPRALGPRLGRQVQEVIRAVKAGGWTASGADADVVTAGGVQLQPGEYQLTLTAADPDSTAALPGSDGLIALDTRVTPELAAEGTARDVIRVIQQARRDACFDVSDRIALVVGADGPVESAVRAHADFIRAETLATTLTIVPAVEVGSPPQPVGDGTEVRVGVNREGEDRDRSI
jgi:isoleucyl-tRNA synthetase